MHSQDQLFDEAVRSQMLGPRLPDDASEREGIMLKNIVEWSYRNGDAFRQSDTCVKKFPNMIIDLVDSPLVNARVFEYKGNFIIAIFKGSINTINYIFKRLLSDRSFMPEIGDVGSEPEELPVFQPTINYIELEQKIAASGYSIIDFMPRDPIRQEVAGFMAFTAIAFLISHEFRHLQAGHLDYLIRGIKLPSYIDEYESSIRDALDFTADPSMMLKIQSLEMDADGASAYRVFKYLCDAHQQTGGTFPGLRHMANSEMALTIMYVACAGLFRVLQPYALPVARWNTVFHPPNIVRRLILMTMAQSYLSNVGNLFFPRGTSLPVEKISSILENNIEQVWGCPLDPIHARRAWLTAPDHMKEIKKTAKLMSSDIRKYSYIEFGDDELF
jgi:hypothetical protein